MIIRGFYFYIMIFSRLAAEAPKAYRNYGTFFFFKNRGGISTWLFSRNLSLQDGF